MNDDDVVKCDKDHFKLLLLLSMCAFKYPVSGRNVSPMLFIKPYHQDVEYHYSQ